MLTLTELLSFQASAAVLARLETAFFSIPDLKIVEVHRRVATESTRIRRTYGFRLPDAIHLATAKIQKAQSFVTNDNRLRAFKEIPLLLLKKK